MDLPAALVRMLEVSCVNDSLRNWSVYQERDGSYTFKIRFSPSLDRHIEDSSIPVPNGSSSSVKNVYKRKSRSQINRDNTRCKAFQEKEKTRPVTRSQTAKQHIDMANRPPKIDPDSSIESVRHCSLSVNSPSFIPSSLDFTDREIREIPVKSDTDESNDDTFCDSDCEPCSKYEVDLSRICNPRCSYGIRGLVPGGRVRGVSPCYAKYYDCLKCKEKVCVPCHEAGAHLCHRKYLKLHD